jgi:hypothetical protein
LQIAHCLIREYPCYRRDAFVNGLTKAGFKIDSRYPENKPQHGNVLVCWNKYGDFEHVANKFKANGGTVMIAENGYLGFDKDGVQNYALALEGHNGSGRWATGDGSRFAKLNIELQAWRKEGEHIAIRGQRGIGDRIMASPVGWAEHMQRELYGKTKRRVLLKPHPGNGAVTDLSHESYLQKAHALVIWSSAVGVKALVMGIPVFYCAPHWICELAAAQGIEKLETPIMNDTGRLAALEKMAWAQWSVAELSTGEPFMRLLELEKQKEAA